MPVVEAALVMTGALLTAVTLTVLVAELLLAAPSFTTNATVRLAVVGFCEVLL